jgi:5-methylcytosine-specific restriction endonuclease McrA
MNLPSLFKKKKIYQTVEKYRVYLERYGREIEKENLRLTQTENDLFDYSSKEYRKLVTDKFIKNKTCQVCGGHKVNDCHHIIPVATSPALALTKSNLIAVCKKCHDEIHEKYKAIRDIVEMDAWVDLSVEENHACKQCGHIFHGPLYHQYCKTCYNDQNRSGYY